MTPHGHRALTLLELLIVVVLIGLAATLVGVRLEGTTDQARLRAATLTIEQTLRLARQRATTRREASWLVFELGSGRYRLTTGDPQRSEKAVWQVLDGIRVARGMFRSEAPHPIAEGVFSVRITASGASLPWALEITSGRRRRVLSTDGVTGRVRHVDDLDLAHFRWDALPDRAIP